MSRSTASFLLLLFAWCVPCVAAAAKPPNVLLILIDDMGFSDAGCYGGEIATPNLDKLAASGLRYTQFYNTARCWPTRASILTGYYPQQVRRDAVPGIAAKAGSQGVRPAFARLLPELLKPLGYRSYHSGKWHVDGPRIKGGFDRSYSVEDHDRHFAPRNHLEDDVKLQAVKPGDNYYSSAAIADHAIKYLKEHAAGHAGKPFFVYLAPIAPHFPLHAPAEDVARYAGKYDAGWDVVRARRFERQREMRLFGDAGVTLPPPEPGTFPAWNPTPDALAKRVGPGEIARAVAWDALTPEQRSFQAAKMAVHAAMIDRTDREIGRVLAQLDAMGAADDTVVLFCSDNGSSAEQIIRGDGHDRAAAVGAGGSYLGLGPGWSSVGNAPFRKHKSWVHDGGIATPLIVRWPKGITARGELRKTVGHVIDVPPTILELAGGTWPSRWGDAEVPPIPGRSLVKSFEADAATPLHEDLWWFHEGHRAVRVGDWKLVADKAGPWELYDLARDRTETKDLAAAQPERVKQMEALWERRMGEFRALASKDLR